VSLKINMLITNADWFISLDSASPTGERVHKRYSLAQLTGSADPDALEADVARAKQSRKEVLLTRFGVVLGRKSGSASLDPESGVSL
jgi:hypothetical protein